MYSCVYRVLRFVPDRFSEERINLGLLAMTRSRLHVRFTDDWDRVRSFSGGPSHDLEEVARAFTAWDGRVTPLRMLLGADPLRDFLGFNDERLRFSEVRSVDLPAGTAADTLAARYLRRAREGAHGAAA
jgi:hypothetical protein